MGAAALSVPALIRLAMPDIGAEVVPGPVLFVLDRWWGWWVVIALTALLVGVGRLMRDLPILRETDEPGLLGIMFDICLGFWALSTACTGLALVGWFRGLPLAGLVTVLITAGCWGLVRRIKDPEPQREDLENDPSPSSGFARPLWQVPLVVAAVLWLLPMALQTLLPDSEWDGAAVHVPLAHKLVQEGLWLTEPEFYHFHNPGLVNLLYGLLLEIRAEASLMPVNFLAVVGVAVLTFALARRLWGQRAGWWALAATVATTLLWELGFDLRVDSFLALTAGWAVAAFVLWVAEPQRRGLLAVAGAGAGMCAGIKYNGLVPVAAVAVGVFLVLITERRRWRFHLPVIVLAIAMAAPSGIWYLRNVVELGSVFYSWRTRRLYFNAEGQLEKFSLALSGYLDRHQPIGSRAELMSRTVRGVDLNTPGVGHLRRKLFYVVDLIRNPNLHAQKPLHWITPVLLLGLLLPVAQRNRAGIMLAVVTLVAAVLISRMTHLVRYAVFLVPLLAFSAGGVLVRMRSRALICTMVAVLGAQIGISAAAEWRKLVRLQPAGLLTGRISRLEWLSIVGYSGAPGMVRLTQMMNQMVREGHADPDEVVFMVAEGKGKDLVCRYHPDPGNNCVPWLTEVVLADGDLDRIAQSFADRRVRFVVFNVGFLSWCLRESVGSRALIGFALDTLDQFLDRNAELVTTEEYVELYEMKPFSPDGPVPPPDDLVGD